jgi:adenosylhomocysteine nucleosidase
MSTAAEPVGFVSAMEMEGRWLGRSNDHHLVEVSGVGGNRAAAAARRLVDRGATALVSWGVAGGLDPALGSGTVVLADRVLHPDGTIRESDSRWRARLEGRVSDRVPTAVGSLIHVDRVVASTADKRRLFERSGATVVDMESLAVAGVADERRLPWLAVRVVTDTATDTLPPEVASLCAENGRLRTWSLAILVVRPRLWPALVLLARTTATAARSMRRVRSLAGPDLALAGDGGR